jgi:ABC-type multidrug transport system fused ATPase/permease subunit
VTPTLTGRLVADDILLRTGQRTLLDGVTLRVCAGEFVAVVGPTGSGKSALLYVLARLRDPDGGTVRYDEHDARSIDVPTLRRQVLCLPQRQWIFEGTLADNVAFAGPGATELELRHAVRRAGLGHMPLDRRLAAGGPDLSAGERQRVGLARALLADPSVLMLDNPTANLDAETEADLLDTLDTLRSSRTIIVATHHEAVARIADRVVELRDGRLTERTATAAGGMR